MHLTYLLIPASLLLLCVPTVLVAPLGVKEKLRQGARRLDDGIGSLLRSPLNWIDLVRGFVGAWIVLHLILKFEEGQDDLELVFSGARYAMLTLGVLAQTVFFRRSLRVIGPLFFLLGLTFVLSGPKVAGFAVVLGLTCALMLRRLSLVFVFIPLSLALFANYFGQLGIPVFLNIVLFGLPAFLAFAFGVRIAYVRRPRRDRRDKEDEATEGMGGEPGVLRFPVQSAGSEESTEMPPRYAKR